jgi:hypothetical protein
MRVILWQILSKANLISDYILTPEKDHQKMAFIGEMPKKMGYFGVNRGGTSA